ncbi:2'-5' RNA ligase family protein [Microbispora catharanthi]|uniref:2'-5' RNA ligase family protein n=1 Tax=Microbispora catharanthi TaxID=1712871 RepID=UPI00197BF688|nr:2'-5' RNA ligase family protein [Microbispora catharanthi]
MAPFEIGETALVVEVPSAEPLVRGLRERYDSSAAYGMPAHVTVLYPFLPRERLDDGVLSALRDLFAERRPFEVAFGGVGRFPGVLYLALDPDGPLRELTEAVVGRWPQTPPYGGRFGDIVPHLTVAEGLGGEVVAGVAAGLAAGLPVTTFVGGVTLRVFDGESWRAEGFFPLGEPPSAEFAFPGPLRDRLVAAILSGDKTATAGLLADYEHCGDPLPVVGRWAALIDSAGRRVALLETTQVRVAPIREIDEAFARDEGEGYDTVAQWRAAHERFWTGPEMSAVLGGPPVVDDDTLIVAERFRLLG